MRELNSKLERNEQKKGGKDGRKEEGKREKRKKRRKCCHQQIFGVSSILGGNIYDVVMI